MSKHIESRRNALFTIAGTGVSILTNQRGIIKDAVSYIMPPDVTKAKEVPVASIGEQIRELQQLSEAAGAKILSMNNGTFKELAIICTNSNQSNIVAIDVRAFKQGTANETYAVSTLGIDGYNYVFKTKFLQTPTENRFQGYQSANSKEITRVSQLLTNPPFIWGVFTERDQGYSPMTEGFMDSANASLLTVQANTTYTNQMIPDKSPLTNVQYTAHSWNSEVDKPTFDQAFAQVTYLQGPYS